jgi:hypothetical protein
VNTANPPARQGRLQRQASANGTYIDSFRQVAKRHGITMGLMAVLGLMFLTSLQPLTTALGPFFETPQSYLAAALALVLFFVWYQRNRGHASHRRNLLWLGYLLFISVVEELAFRLILPLELSAIFPTTAAILLSNVIFAGLHYVTLRWHWWNCVVAFLGGLAFSHMLARSGDLTQVILAHWFFTFINTPMPPKRRNLRATTD